MNEIKTKENQTRLELFGELISTAFNPANPHKPEEIYPGFFKSMTSYFEDEDDGKEFAKEVGMHIQKNGEISYSIDVFLRHFKRLVGQHLKIDDNEEYLSIVEMDFNLFKKLQLSWFLEPRFYSQLPNIWGMETGKSEMVRRIQTFINQIHEHTIVENWKLLKPHLVQIGVLTEFEANLFESDFMMTKMFPFVTDYSELEFFSKPKTILEAYRIKAEKLLNTLAGNHVSNSRSLIRKRVDLLWGKFPSLWKSKTLEHYYKHKGLDLDFVLCESEILGLTLNSHAKATLQTQEIMKFEHVYLKEIHCSNGENLAFVPWHESSHFKFFVEYFGKIYADKLEAKCKELNQKNPGFGTSSINKKVKSVFELTQFLESRPGDIIKFSNLGLGLDILKLVIILKDNEVKEGKSKINWSLIHSYLSTKLTEKDQKFIESWFENHTI